MSVIQLPELRLDQLRIALHPAKTKVVIMGRRWGKTVLGGALTGNVLRQHGATAWVVPEYKNSRPLWRWAQRTFSGHPDFRVNRGERTIETRYGGFFGVYSADNIDSIRSEAFDLVVVDEGARVSEEAVTDAIIPTLADKDGDLIIPTTPNGKNWLHRWYLQGLEGRDGMMSWNAPTSDNPLPNIQKAFRMARERLAERTFRQEWLAQFLDDGGEVFRNVRLCANGNEPVYEPRPELQYVIGVDPAKSNDWFVASVFECGTGRQMWIDRSNHVEYLMQADRLAVLAERYNHAQCIIEINMNETFAELCQRKGIGVIPFTTTNATKAAIIGELAVALEKRTIQLIDEPVQLGEMEAYTMERLPSGMMRYNAPEGMNDDTVIANALGWHGASQTFEDAFDVGYDSSDFEFGYEI